MSAHWSDAWLTIHGGDCREVMRGLEPESVHCVVTSPPYWGLRDYGTPGQLGLEATPEEYVASMVDVFREVRRVLRPDGTVWLNLGDSYANANPTGRRDADRRGEAGVFADGEYRERQSSGGGAYVKPLPSGLKPKDLVGIPWRVAFALQADGWYLRSDIVWAKPNPMPESVTDRPTKAHEYVFLLAKSARYFYDADAVREPQQEYGGADGYRSRVGAKQYHDGNSDPKGGGLRGAGGFQTTALNPAGRNLRSVWTIATAPYPGAHFATFPPKLVEPCVKAGTSERGVCPDCGAPWTRVVEREVHANGAGRRHIAGGDRTIGQGWEGTPRATVSTSTTGWGPTCDHGDDPVPAVVLDPFAGTGTVGMVAQSLSRRAVLIDLNPAYLAQCLGRNRQMPLGVGS